MEALEKIKEAHKPQYLKKCQKCGKIDCICKPMTDEVKYGNREVSKKFLFELHYLLK